MYYKLRNDRWKPLEDPSAAGDQLLCQFVQRQTSGQGHRKLQAVFMALHSLNMCLHSCSTNHYSCRSKWNGQQKDTLDSCRVQFGKHSLSPALLHTHKQLLRPVTTHYPLRIPEGLCVFSFFFSFHAHEHNFKQNLETFTLNAWTDCDLLYVACDPDIHQNTWGQCNKPACQSSQCQCQSNNACPL